MANLRAGQSGIVDLSQPPPYCGALIQPAVLSAAAPLLHPRLSPRYNQALTSFCGRVRQLVQRWGPFQQVFLLCKSPFYSKFAFGAFSDQAFLKSLELALGLDSPACLLQAACSTGIVALNWAVRELAQGGLAGKKTLLVGLETELNPEKFVAFKKLGALSLEKDPTLCCQPFSASRSGLVPGEVMVAMVLEAVDGVESGDLLLQPGFTNCDASRLTDGLESGDYLWRCLQSTLPSEQLEAIDFLCPHATSTPLNDSLEGKVLSRYFADCPNPPRVVPLKQYLGHTLNSSGLWETVVAAELVRHNFLPALLHAPDLESFAHLRFVTEGLTLPLRRALKLSIGFGGINSALLIEKAL